MTASIRSTGSRPVRRDDPLAVLSHLTERDRQLMTLLDDHRALTTDQVHRVFFTAMRTCQNRLRLLYHLDVLDRFRYPSPLGPQTWHWTLGMVGARYRAAAAGRPLPTERAHRARTWELSANPALKHLLLTNEFFIRLLYATRTRRGTRVQRWWSEPAATAAFLGVRPDGHLLWTANRRTVGAFVEVDRGTENLARLSEKLAPYARLAAGGGPRYPVLFWLPSRERETNLRRHLHGATTGAASGAAPLLATVAAAGVTIATATHDAEPADDVWLPVDSWRRVPLSDLPSDHGPDTAHNPNWKAGQLDLT